MIRRYEMRRRVGRTRSEPLWYALCPHHLKARRALGYVVVRSRKMFAPPVECCDCEAADTGTVTVLQRLIEAEKHQSAATERVRVLRGQRRLFG